MKTIHTAFNSSVSALSNDVLHIENISRLRLGKVADQVGM